MVLDLEFFTHFLHHFIVKIQPVISDDIVWSSILAYDFFLDEAGNNLLGHILVRSRFHPLGEVINSNKNKPIPFEELGSMRPII